jgi:hypothetical protein
MSKKGRFVFQKSDRVGYADAEEDYEFLLRCFVDTGDINVLRDTTDPRRIIIGRTGSGKTALIQQMIASEERVIPIPPESLALSYVSNSDILKFVTELGVKLDTFFKLLWRHVLAVEIIRAHFSVKNEEAQRGFLTSFRDIFRTQKHQKALAYLENWGKTFWEDTDYRIKEVTTTFERDLKGAIGLAKFPITFNLEGARSLTEEQRQDVVQRSRSVINEVQIRELSYVIDLIADILSDPQKRYYLVIDRLDENWVDEQLRYTLIRALIETARDFNKIRNAKVVIALRVDLLERVFRLTRDAGFQEEKYEDLYLDLSWLPDQLTELIDARISYLVSNRYSSGRVTHRDVFPPDIDGIPVMEWVLNRTLMRPRDCIAFVNEAIAQAVGRSRITVKMMREAEGHYSRGRLRSLADEWVSDFPNLIRFTDLLKLRPSQFRMCELTDEECEAFCLEVAVERVGACPLQTIAVAVAEGNLSPRLARNALIEIFYKVGLVGLKLERYETFVWASRGRRSISSAELNEDTRIAINPPFWRTLGITP